MQQREELALMRSFPLFSSAHHNVFGRRGRSWSGRLRQTQFLLQLEDFQAIIAQPFILLRHLLALSFTRV